MKLERIDDSNFLLYAAKHYDNAQCHDTAEFYDDLKRFKYIKRLFIKYQESGELRERLILNHIIVLYNMFGDEATRMLFFKLDGFYTYLKPFLILLRRMPDAIYMVGHHDIVYSSDILMDSRIVEELRKI